MWSILLRLFLYFKQDLSDSKMPSRNYYFFWMNPVSYNSKEFLHFSTMPDRTCYSKFHISVFLQLIFTSIKNSSYFLFVTDTYQTLHYHHIPGLVLLLDSQASVLQLHDLQHSEIKKIIIYGLFFISYKGKFYFFL